MKSTKLPQSVLTVVDHSRDSANLEYVYPVVSRRAGGVSLGINLNPNDACNFRCIYCQVPNLRFGKAPTIDLQKLERELRELLQEILHGDFLLRRAPEGARRLNDLAFSGNGEPTSSRQFDQCVQVVSRVRAELDVPLSVKTILITNGSSIARPEVLRGLDYLAQANGEVWFKFDSATPAGTRLINNSTLHPDVRFERLRSSAERCPTWIQSCFFALDGAPPTDAECDAYVAALGQVRQMGIDLRGILLYGLARQSQQPEASRLSRLEASWFDTIAVRLRALGYEVKITP